MPHVIKDDVVIEGKVFAKEASLGPIDVISGHIGELAGIVPETNLQHKYVPLKAFGAAETIATVAQTFPVHVVTGAEGMVTGLMIGAQVMPTNEISVSLLRNDESTALVIVEIAIDTDNTASFRLGTAAESVSQGDVLSVLIEPADATTGLGAGFFCAPIVIEE